VTKRYRIGEVARRYQVSVRTLRYYEELGLIPEGNRTESNQRCYSERDLEHIATVLRLKQMGFALRDIQQAYGLCHDEQGTLEERYARKYALLQKRRDWLEKRISELHLALASVHEGMERVAARTGDRRSDPLKE